MINQLKNWIVTQCETVTELNGNTYTSNKENPDEYPVAIITFVKTDADMNTIRTSYRRYVYNVSLQYEIGSEAMTVDEIDTALYNIVDSIIDKFDSNRSAGGIADLLLPTGGQAQWLDTDHQIRYCDIRLEFLDIRNAS
jgi:hypothetical protein